MVLNVTEPRFNVFAGALLFTNVTMAPDPSDPTLVVLTPKKGQSTTIPQARVTKMLAAA